MLSNHVVTIFTMVVSTKGPIYSTFRWQGGCLLCILITSYFGRVLIFFPQKLSIGLLEIFSLNNSIGFHHFFLRNWSCLVKFIFFDLYLCSCLVLVDFSPKKSCLVFINFSPRKKLMVFVICEVRLGCYFRVFIVFLRKKWCFVLFKSWHFAIPFGAFSSVVIV